MEPVFTWLNGAVEGAPGVAVAAAFTWGVLSVLLSPCHLASIPLIVGVLADQRELNTGRAFRAACVFGIGILATIAAIGLVTVALGRVAGDIGASGNLLVVVVFFGVGLHLLDVWRLPLWDAGIGSPGRSVGSALLLGLVLGTALGPCTFAFMAPVLAAVFRTAATAPAYAGLLLLAYGIGHTSLLVVAGVSTGAVQAWLDWSETSRGLSLLKKACGFLLLCGGLYQIYVM